VVGGPAGGWTLVSLDLDLSGSLWPLTSGLVEAQSQVVLESVVTPIGGVS